MPSRLSWSLEVQTKASNEALILRRDTLLEETQLAAKLCVDGLTNHFKLSREADAGIADRFVGTKVWLSSGGSECEQRDVLPVGVFSNVVDLRTREPVLRRPSPEVRMSIEGIAEEAENLLNVANMFCGTKVDEGITEKTRDKLQGFIEERSLLVGAASRIAAARRMVKYIILAEGVLNERQEKQLGFKTWYDEQVLRHGSGPLSAKMKSKVKARYAEEGIALKNLRRTAWPAVFFGNIGVDPTEVVFYMAYRDVISRNQANTVTFNSPLATYIPIDEARTALETIFARPIGSASSPRPKPVS